MRNHLAFRPPRGVHLLESEVVTMGEESPHITRRSIGVNTAFFYEKLVDGFAVT